MSETAEKTDPALWERVKAEVTAGAKGGKPGQWSARKAQMAVQEYQHRGGGYVGARDPHNSLHEWTEEHWTTKSGEKSGDTGERYLPEAAIAALSDEDYARTTASKRKATKEGHQFPRNPPTLRPGPARSATTAPGRSSMPRRRSAASRGVVG